MRFNCTQQLKSETAGHAENHLLSQHIADATAGAVSADEQIVGQLLRVLTCRTQLQPPRRHVDSLATVQPHSINAQTRSSAREGARASLRPY